MKELTKYIITGKKIKSILKSAIGPKRKNILKTQLK